MQYTLHNLRMALIGSLLLMMAVPAAAQRRIYASDRATQQAYKGNRDISRYDKERRSNHNGLLSDAESGIHHYLGFWVEGAYSTYIHNVPGVSKGPGGYGLGAGLVYELQNSYFLFQAGIGIKSQDVKYTASSYSFDNYDLANGKFGQKDKQWLPAAKGGALQDSWGESIDTLRYTVINRKDQVRTISAQVPLLVGGRFNGFYGLAGVKINIAFSQTAIANMDIYSMAKYNQYEGWMTEMDNHGYRGSALSPVPVPESKKTYSSVQFDLMASLELGYEFHQKTNRIRLAAFADCGMLNICPQKSDPSLAFSFADRYDVGRYQFNNIFRSNVAKDSRINNFFVGAKLTFLFQLPSAKDKCILCRQASRH